MIKKNINKSTQNHIKWIKHQISEIFNTDTSARISARINSNLKESNLLVQYHNIKQQPVRSQKVEWSICAGDVG